MPGLYKATKDEAARLVQLIKRQLVEAEPTDNTTMVFMQNITYGTVNLEREHPANGKRMQWFHIRDTTVASMPIDYWVTCDPEHDDNFYIVEFFEVEE